MIKPARGLLTLSQPKGFTLIELLLVIAIIGVLAAVVLIAINPIKRINAAQDSGRKNNLAQVANAIEVYYTTVTPSQYPTSGPCPGAGCWITLLAPAGGGGALKVFPANPEEVAAQDQFGYRVVDCAAGVRQCSSVFTVLETSGIGAVIDGNTVFCWQSSVGGPQEVNNGVAHVKLATGVAAATCPAT